MVAIEELGLRSRRGQGFAGKGVGVELVHPAAVGGNVAIGLGGQVTGLGVGFISAPFQVPFLQVQKNLVVFEHAVVADVAVPAGGELDEQTGQLGVEFERKPGEQATFPLARRRGVDHRQGASELPGRQVVVHQPRRGEGGVLGAELALARTLLPDAGKSPLAKFRDGDGHRRGGVPFADGFVVGVGDVARVQDVFQQGEGVVGQISKCVEHHPALGVLFERLHQRQVNPFRPLGPARIDEQQPLSDRRRQGGGAGAGGPVRPGVPGLLGNDFAFAGSGKGPAVVGTFQPSRFVHPSLGERRESVGTPVGEHPPGLGSGFPPDRHVPPQQDEPGGPRLVQILDVVHGIPGFPHVESVGVVAPGGQRLGGGRRLGDRRLSRRHGRRLQVGGKWMCDFIFSIL